MKIWEKKTLVTRVEVPRAELEQVLRAAGVEIPEGAKFWWDPRRQQLVIKATEER